MIIIRQKFFAAQDYAGVKTAKQAENIKTNRGVLAGLKTWGMNRNKRWLDRQNSKVSKLGLNEKEAAVMKQNLLETYNNRNQKMQNRMERRLKVANSIVAPANTLVGQNPGGTITKTTTKNNPTTTYIANNPPKPAVTQPKAIAAPSNSVISQPGATTTPTTPAQNGAAAGAKFGQFMKNNGGKVALGAAAVGTGAYLLYKRNQKKKEEEQKAQQASGTSAY